MKKSNLKTVYLKEKIVKYTLTLFVFISIVTTIGIVISLVTESLPFFGEGRGFNYWNMELFGIQGVEATISYQY